MLETSEQRTSSPEAGAACEGMDPQMFVPLASANSRAFRQPWRLSGAARNNSFGMKLLYKRENMLRRAGLLPRIARPEPILESALNRENSVQKSRNNNYLRITFLHKRKNNCPRITLLQKKGGEG